MRMEEGFVPVELRIRGEPWEPVVEARVYAVSSGKAGEAFARLLDVVRVWFRYADFLKVVKRWSCLYRLALAYPGLRPGRCLSLYEALVDVVVKQRVALRVALGIGARLVERYGAKVIIGDRVFYSYPEPASLAGASLDELRSLGLTRLKARALHEVAQAELENRLPNVEEAVDEPWEAARELQRLYGIGPWSAELAVAMVHPLFPLGPSSDLAVRRGLSAIMGRELGSSEVARVLSELGDYAGLVMYLAAFHYENQKHRRE